VAERLCKREPVCVDSVRRGLGLIEVVNFARPMDRILSALAEFVRIWEVILRIVRLVLIGSFWAPCQQHCGEFGDRS